MTTQLKNVRWSALLGGVAAKKLDFLTDRGAKVVCVKVYFEMPNGDEGMVDSWGRVDWNGIRPGILAREVAEVQHLFSVRELSEELESGARCNGCDSDDQRPRSADSPNRECDSPDQNQSRPIITACADCGENAPESGMVCDECREDTQGDA